MDKIENTNNPHLVIQTPDGNAHVVPVEMVKRFVYGELPLAQIEDAEQLFRKIAKEWLMMLSEPCEVDRLHLRGQIDRLANFFLAERPEWILEGGAVENAIRVMRGISNA